MKPIILNTPNIVTNNIYNGDTWCGMTIKLNTCIAEHLPNIDSIRMQVRGAKDVLIYEFTTECGSANGVPIDFPTRGNITIWDKVDWVFSIDSQMLPFGTGAYIWDIEVIDILGIVRTILKGSLTICADITKGA